jgi:hypothetical protein
MEVRFQYLKQAMNERFSRIRACLDALERQLAEGKLDGICHCAALLNDACGEYASFVPENLRPDWLKRIWSAAGQCTKNNPPEVRMGLIRALIEQSHRIEPVPFVEVSEAPSFDQIYAQMAEQGKLRELFDKMIDAIESILASGQIRERECIDALNKIVALLRANKKGSIFAMKDAIFTSRFLLNFVKEFIYEVPVLGQFMKAVEATQDEMEKELKPAIESVEAGARRAIVSEVQEELLVKFKELQRPLIAYDSKGSAEGAAALEQCGSHGMSDGFGSDPSINGRDIPTE